MDPLSDALNLARFTGAVFLEARFTAPWSVLTRASATPSTSLNTI
jgi:hypothetical protein